MGPRDRRRGDQDGFTLIELLVVIIIIGILSAIAIPVYLAQRQRAYDATGQSDLHSLAEFEEAYLADYGTYGNFAQLVADNDSIPDSPGNTISIVHLDGALGYCLSATPANGERTIWYDSQAGGFQPSNATGCPVTTTGPSYTYVPS